MQNAVINKIQNRFASFNDLIDAINDDLLGQSIAVPKHKTLNEHLWCVIVARESYTAALQAGAWAGFNCSVTQFDTEHLKSALNNSAEIFTNTVNNISEWSDSHNDLLLDLLEHEVMHEGQIIRHMYAMNLSLPDSWKWA